MMRRRNFFAWFLLPLAGRPVVPPAASALTAEFLNSVQAEVCARYRASWYFTVPGNGVGGDALGLNWDDVLAQRKAEAAAFQNLKLAGFMAARPGS